LLNLKALAATGSARQLGAKDGDDVLLEVVEIGSETEAQRVVDVCGGRARGNAGRSMRNDA